MVARRPRVPPSLHAPLYTRAQVRALTQYGPYIRAYLEVERWRRGCKATATPPPSMLLLFAKRCIILSAMPGISKRNTSGFAIVLRICSPIHNLPLHGLLLLLLTSLRSIHAATSPPFLRLVTESRSSSSIPLLPLRTRLESRLIHGCTPVQITRKSSRGRRHSARHVVHRVPI